MHPSPEQVSAACERIFEFLPGSRPPTDEEVRLAGMAVADVPGKEGRDLRKKQVGAKKHVDATPITADQKEAFIKRLSPYLANPMEHRVHVSEVFFPDVRFEVLGILNSMGLKGDELIKQTPLELMKVVFSDDGRTIVGNDIVFDPSSNGAQSSRRDEGQYWQSHRPSIKSGPLFSKPTS